MESTTITGTGLRSSRIGLGTWAIGGSSWGGTDEADAIRTIHAALERGINLIDTAPVYGFGRAEEIVGRALALSPQRDQVIIATKSGPGVERARTDFPQLFSAAHSDGIDDSLRRLRTEVIDLYQVHWPDPKISIEETAQTLAELQRAGKIRARPDRSNNSGNYYLGLLL